MITANELRIGNWVNFSNDGINFKVIDISSGGIGVKNLDEETWIELDQFSGIPLTPERLEKAGFVYDWDTYRLNIKGSGVIDWSDDGSVGIGHHGDKFLFAGNGPCKYVHQLQNLYWCLCGQELEINL